MLIKQEIEEIVNTLPNDANWDDFIRVLIKNKKLTIGMTSSELGQDSLSEPDVSAVLARLQSSQAIPGDMRNTKKYNPSNAVTIGVVGGIIAIFFAFVFPPISWLGAIVAMIAGLVGLKDKQPKAWVPILMAMVSVVPIMVVFF